VHNEIWDAGLRAEPEEESGLGNAIGAGEVCSRALPVSEGLSGEAGKRGYIFLKSSQRTGH
jgi:hypothetical protein